MNVLIYTPNSGEFAQRLREKIERMTEVVPRFFSDLNEMKLALRRPMQHPPALVVMADNPAELSRFHGLGDLLSRGRLILVIPDWRKETVDSAHTFRPRFLTDADGDGSDITAVLGKMARSSVEYAS